MRSLTGARWRSNLESRLADRGDDRGVALLTALMFMIFATGLSLVLLSAILSQAVPAYTAQKNTRTVYAAQAGLQSALAIIRSAAAPVDTEGHIFGAPSKLPCSVTGNVSADGTGATYSASVQYFSSDPTNMTSDWRTANSMACSPLGGLADVPKYAYVASTGQDVAIPGNATATTGNRALSAIYKFNITNINISGGLIYSSGSTYCLEAVPATITPPAPAKVKFVPAASCLNTSLQLWNYTADYRLQLASSTAGGAAGICITGPAAYGGATQDATLETCRPRTDAARWNQLWSWTGDYTWQGQNTTNTNVSNHYLSPGTVGAGALLKVSLGRSGSFIPSLSVGAGAANYSTHQLVNYLEFGRCADVTSRVITSTYMISYPCKQDPSGTGANLDWNHKWYYTEPVLPATTSPIQDIHVFSGAGIGGVTENDSNKRCLTAPAVGGVELKFEVCNPSDVRQQWTRVNNTGDYSSSYLVINQGKCLFADKTSTHTDGNSSKLRLATCNGSLAQKWNAPPVHVDATFGGYREVAP